MASGRYLSFGSSRKDLETAWKDRLEDAEQFRSAGRCSTAITHGLYALEILLKVWICRLLGLNKLPKAFEIHDLEDLLVLSGLTKPMASRNTRRIKTSWERILIVSTELNTLRYRPGSSKVLADSDAFSFHLNDTSDGVIPWISTQV